MMTKNVEFVDFNRNDDASFNFFTHLYNLSFPKKERRAISNIYYLLENNNKYNVKLIVADGQSVGLLCYWDLNDFIFAEHIAIDHNLRNKGIGTDALNLFMSNTTKPIILEIELQKDDITKRRWEFYKRLGFTIWEDIFYEQPPYHETTSSVEMKLLTKGNLDLSINYDKIKGKIYREVYKIKEEYM